MKVFYDPYRDGITYSLLAKWMECREKAKLHLEGLTPKYRSFALTFGTVVHEALNRCYDDFRLHPNKKLKYDRYLLEIEKTWTQENPGASTALLQDFEMALLYCEAVLPVYFHFWEKDRHLTWVSLEGKFDVPWRLPNGHVVQIRGRRDGVFRRPGQKGLNLLETKTKSRIDEGSLIDRLSFEQQVMIYLLTMTMEVNDPITSVLYNIIRRPLLRQGKTEPLAVFAKRCAQDVKERPDFYFVRFNVSIGKSEILAFKKELGAAIWDFVQWYEGKVGHYRNTGACENKYGTCEMLPICSSGNNNRFFKRKVVFSELEG